MNFFAVLQGSGGEAVHPKLRQRFSAAPCCGGLPKLRWMDVSGISVLLAADPLVGGRPVLAQWDRFIGVGTLRLDHPDEVARLAGVQPDLTAQSSDMELVLRAFERRGEQCISELIGDFAFVVFDIQTRDVLAARDPLGVKTLYTVDHPELLGFASRAELLAENERYDVQYVAEFLSGARPGRTSTIYAGVRPIQPGSILSITGGLRSSRTYWNAATFAMHRNEVRTSGYQSKIDEFHQLFARAVQSRMTGAPDTWSELSGGLDSSSVVSMAQTLARSGQVASGLGGTVTVVDRAGTGGDERVFSDAVVQLHGVRNELLSDYWMLQDDGDAPPITGQPTRRLLFYARDRALSQLVRRGGGLVLLGGQASDQYLTGYIFFIADWLARGHIAKAIRELTRWSVLGNVSFWEIALKNVVMPFLPPWLNARISKDAAIPSWIPPQLARRFELDRRQVIVRAYAGPVGRKYAAAMVRSVGDIPYGLDRGIVDDNLEFRYPFLYRPLVEFGLGLPPQLCAVPTEPKWILRQAMAGILPESIRRRRGKGAIEARLAWSMARESHRIDYLLDNSILAELGCIDVQPLRSAAHAAARGGELNQGIVDALALELWLAVRSGRQTLANPRVATTG